MTHATALANEASEIRRGPLRDRLTVMPAAYIAMGANLSSPAGPPEATLMAAAARLESVGRVTARSSLYSTRPVGLADQPRFVNAVVELETELEPRALLDALLAIEHQFGRDRSSGIRNGPRTLDLDILLFGGLELSEPGLEIPHPRLAERKFVLIPLSEIAPAAVYPGSNETVKQLLYKLSLGAASEDDAAIPVEWEGWLPGQTSGQLSGRISGARGHGRAGTGPARTDSHR